MTEDITLIEIIVAAAASASLWILVVRDTVTRPLRHWVIRRVLRASKPITVDGELVMPSRNAFFWWLEYLGGCALCFPIWAAAGFILTHELGPSKLNTASWFVQAVLMARLVAWGGLKWMRDETVRDWPPQYVWPPEKK